MGSLRIVAALVIGWIIGYVWRSWLAYTDYRANRETVWRLDQLLSRVYMACLLGNGQFVLPNCYFCGQDLGAKTRPHKLDCLFLQLENWNDKGRGYVNSQGVVE